MNMCKRLGHNLRQLGEVGQRLEVGVGDVVQPLVERGAAVARRHVHRLHARRLRQLPRQRVLAAAAADHQDLHWNSVGSEG